MPIKKIRFLWNNLFDAGTITASSEVAGYPVTCIQNRWHTLHWRSDGAGNEEVIIDLLDPAKDIKALAIKYHNLLTGANLKLRCYSDAWMTLDLEVDLTPAIVTGKPIVKFWETAINYRWLKLFLGDVNPGGDRIGRMFLGDFFQPTYDITRPPHSKPIDPSIKLYSDDGQASSRLKTHYQIISFEFDMIPEVDKVIFESMFAHVGRSVDYFICRDPDDAANTTYYVQNISDFDYPPQIHGWYGLNIDVETLR